MREIILDLTRIEAIALHEAVALDEPEAWHGSYLASLRDRLSALIVAHDGESTIEDTTSSAEDDAAWARGERD